jgi:hypothetical protein
VLLSIWKDITPHLLLERDLPERLDPVSMEILVNDCGVRGCYSNSKLTGNNHGIPIHFEEICYTVKRALRVDCVTIFAFVC